MLDKIVKNNNSIFIDDDLTDLSWLVQWKEQTSFQDRNNFETKFLESKIKQKTLKYPNEETSQDYARKRFHYDQYSEQNENYYPPPPNNFHSNNYVCPSSLNSLGNNSSLEFTLLPTSSTTAITTPIVSSFFSPLSLPKSDENCFNDSYEPVQMTFDNQIQMHHSTVKNFELTKLNNNKCETYPDDIEQLLEIFKDEYNHILSSETDDTLKLIEHQSGYSSNGIENITNFYL
ncbi:unnamed protein product [Didymodactylos carnosus]|uniref:Uncharacterized protein n=1 Tax=Didymodactylos carnosus TaxID=1234261 RepID=A0A8S2TAD3_9BILA|nr:unnamed protein product [Didymodactylos carnosus]CAF4275689.1 unnamed protein product [Didymodactylos carnosus]